MIKTGWRGNPVRARSKLVKMATDNVPVEQRQFGEADHLRPSFVEFNRCENVLIEGVKIRRSPMWELHPLLCTNVTVRGVDIFSARREQRRLRSGKLPRCVD